MVGEQAGPSQLCGHRNQILLHLFMFTIKENQDWGKKYNPRGCFGWNLLEIVDDNAASCVYIVKQYTFKCTITKGCMDV